MADALAWYLVLALVGAASLLPASLLLGRLASGGVLYARALGLAVLAYLAWLPGALGLASYGTGAAWAAVAALLALSAYLAWRDTALPRALWRRRRLLLAGEALFAVLFVLLLLARAQAPAAAGTEKPMDLRLLAAIDGAAEFPPADPWFAGEPISYYYLGHVGVDAVGGLAGVGIGAAFTLGVATAGAAAGVAAAGLALDLLALGGGAASERGGRRGRRGRRSFAPAVAGGVAVVGLLWLAPLAGAIEVAGANGVGRGLAGALGVEGLPGPEGATDLVPDRFWWWWDATRIVPGAIAEFPAFSLLLGDLHAHLLALPAGVVALALAATAFAGGTPLTMRRWLGDPARLGLAAMLFAALFMTNSWDVLSYGLIWLLAALWAFRRAGWPWALAALLGARYLLAPALAALALALPFLLPFEGRALGVALVADSGSEPVRFALFWLAPALPLGLALALLRPRARARSLALGGALAAMPVAAWAAATLLSGDAAALVDRGSGWLTLAALVAALGGASALALAAERAGRAAAAAALALAAGAAALVLATELLFLEDAFGTRMNTVFKLWFHAWLLLAVAGAVACGAAVARAPALSPRLLLRGATSSLGGAATAAVLALGGVLLLGSLAYAPAAAVARSREGQAAGLDALAYLDRAAPGEAAALRWARAELDPHEALLLEAVGPSYGSGNRVSAASGVPTLLGWPGHELQWRRDPPIGELLALVERAYAAGATEETRRLLRGRGVTHVYLGAEERRQHGDGVAQRFEGWPVVFEAAGVRVVRVPSEAGTVDNGGGRERARPEASRVADEVRAGR